MLRSTAARMVSVPSGLLTCLLIFSALRTGCAMLMSRSDYGSLDKSVRGSTRSRWAALMHRAALVATVCHRILTRNLKKRGALAVRPRRSPGFKRAMLNLLGLGLALSGLVQAAAAPGNILVLGDS